MPIKERVIFDETKEGKMKTWAKIGCLVVSVGLALPAAGLNAADRGPFITTISIRLAW
jgi:hypothetical protein